jgi:hypothetical protein
LKPSIKQRWTPFQQKPMAGVRQLNDECYHNATHSVIITPLNDEGQLPEDRLMDGWLVLSIRRNDRAAECDWRIFQRIKNDLVGMEREGVQLFPAMSRCVDSANQYFIIVAPKGYYVGLGYRDQLIVAHDAINRPPGSVQRPFEQGCPIGSEALPVPNGPPFDVVFPLPLYPTDAVKDFVKLSPRPGTAGATTRESDSEHDDKRVE